MDSFKLTAILKKNKLNDLDKLSAFIFRQLNKKSTVDYHIINNYDSLDNGNNDISNAPCEVNLTEFREDSAAEDEQKEHHPTTLQKPLQEIKINEKINPAEMTSYFPLSINNKLYNIHKQTATRLCTANKIRLSYIRLLRVKPHGKQP
jgi:hypothetical protein